MPRTKINRIFKMVEVILVEYGPHLIALGKRISFCSFFANSKFIGFGNCLLRNRSRIPKITRNYNID